MGFVGTVRFEGLTTQYNADIWPSEKGPAGQARRSMLRILSMKVLAWLVVRQRQRLPDFCFLQEDTQTLLLLPPFYSTPNSSVVDTLPFPPPFP